MGSKVKKVLIKNYEYLKRLAASANGDSRTEANNIAELYKNRNIRNVTTAENLLIRLKDDSKKKRNTAKRRVNKNMDKWALGLDNRKLIKSIAYQDFDRPKSFASILLDAKSNVVNVPKGIPDNEPVPFDGEYTPNPSGDTMTTIFSKLTSAIGKIILQMLTKKGGAIKASLSINYKRAQVYKKKDGQNMYRHFKDEAKSSPVTITKAN